MIDPRPDFRLTAAWAGDLVDTVTPAQLDDATPCEHWSVRDLLGHMVAVLERLRAIGQGADLSTTTSMLTGIADDQWSVRYTEALAAWDEVWSDDAVLSRAVEAPFGTMPGAQVLGGYIVEYLTHGWDLARATGRHTEAPGDLAQRALSIARQILPADERGGPVPFEPPITPRPQAGPTEQLANWLGRAA